MKGIFLIVQGDFGTRLVFHYPVLPADIDLMLQDTKNVNTEGERDYTKFVYGLPSVEFSSLFCPKPNLCGNVLELSLNGMTFVSFPVRLVLAESVAFLTFFNVVFVLDGDDDMNLKAALYRRAAVKLANSLLYEEVRCAFISEEAQVMVQVHERLASVAASKEFKQLPRKHAQKVIANLLCREMLNESKLARDLKQIQEGLGSQAKAMAEEGFGMSGDASLLQQERELGNTHVRLLVNEWMNVNFTLNPRVDQSLIDHSSIRPYHSLLLIVDRAKLLKTLPKDCAPLLSKFIMKLDPWKTFGALEVMTDTSMSQLCRFATHLIYWKKAKLIVAPTMYCKYVTTHKLDNDTMRQLSHAFDAQFGKEYNLRYVLEKFSAQCELGDHLRRTNARARKQFMNVLVWLLRRQLLKRLNTVVYHIPHVFNASTEEHFHAQPSSAVRTANGILPSSPPSSLPRTAFGILSPEHGVSSFSSVADAKGGGGLKLNPRIQGILGMATDGGSAGHSMIGGGGGQSLMKRSSSYTAISDAFSESSVSHQHHRRRMGSGGSGSPRFSPSSSMLGLAKTPSLSHLSALPSSFLADEGKSSRSDNPATAKLASNPTPAHKTLFERLRPYFNGQHEISEIVWKEAVTYDQLLGVLEAYGDVLSVCTLESDDNKFIGARIDEEE